MGRVLIALGGNAIKQPEEKGTAAEQLDNIGRTAAGIADVIVAGNEVVVTHGNGPQVGAILLQNELASDAVPPMPLDVCGAESQGQLGYFIQQSLANALRARGAPREVVTVVTQTTVAADDPAFQKPSKPVGPFRSAEEARRRAAVTGQAWMDDAGRGWRRVVASPRPLGVVEAPTIERLLRAGVVVIAAGGGGVPVIESRAGALRGVEAVVDKDLASVRLALQLRMQTLLILTDVPGVAIGYGTAGQRFLGAATVDDLRACLAEGQFAAGSMAPKVRAAIEFLEGGGQRVVVCSLDEALAGLEGKAGTQVRARLSRLHRRRVA